MVSLLEIDKRKRLFKLTDTSTAVQLASSTISGKWSIKKTKVTVEGADVELTKVVLRWKGRKDDTITKVGVLKAGGQTAPKDAPGREATLTSVAVQYKILDKKPTATIKVWGYD